MLHRHCKPENKKSRLSSPGAILSAFNAIIDGHSKFSWQVAKVARLLAGKGASEEEAKISKDKGTVMVMTLLDGGTSSRQKAWLKVCMS